MNLLMVAPLRDSRGIVRYHIGAQVDVSGLARECAGLESLARLVAQEEDAADPDPEKHYSHHHDPLANGNGNANGNVHGGDKDGDEFRELAEMFSAADLKTVRETGGAMHRIHHRDEAGAGGQRSRILIRDESQPAGIHSPSEPALTSLLAGSPSSGGGGAGGGGGGRLRGVFEHYLLVRPHPNLRIVRVFIFFGSSLPYLPLFIPLGFN